jgi:acyl dehydratase
MISCASLSVGHRLPGLRVAVTAKTIIMGAVASRDWQPQHHDRGWARHEAGLPDIIMNNYTQAGFISRFITDWSGPHGRIGRLKFAMKRPIRPGDDLAFDGEIVGIIPTVSGFSWVDVAVRVSAAEALATTAQVRLALPSQATSPSPWRCPRQLWAP